MATNINTHTCMYKDVVLHTKASLFKKAES